MSDILVDVRNRTMGGTGYRIPDTGVIRSFAYGESKKIPLSELQQLQYIPGGEYLLKHSFLINDRNALEVLNMSVEPEYFYTEEDIKKILETGTLDQLDDLLTFGKESNGVIDLVKKIAVDIEVPDTRKRKMILDKVGFNVDTAIMIRHLDDEDETEAEENKAPTRKAEPIKKETDEKPVRKYIIPSENK